MYTAENALLRVKRIRKSKNGPFSVGELTTDIGTFKVKDPILDQFEEGEYVCTAWICEIHLASYIYYGKAVVEMRVRLQDIQVLTEASQAVEHEPLEPDPIDEPAPVQVPPVPAQQPAAPAPAAQQAQAEGGVALLALYDEEIAEAIRTGAPIKLDTTVERSRLREQAADLKARGYRFDSKTQTFVK